MKDVHSSVKSHKETCYLFKALDQFPVGIIMKLGCLLCGSLDPAIGIAVRRTKISPYLCAFTLRTLYRRDT